MSKQFKKFAKVSLLVLSLFTLSATLFAAKSQAQQAGGLDVTISPSVIELNGNPGDVIQQKFRIRNNSAAPVDLSILVGKLEPHSENGQVVPVEPQPGDVSTSWLTFDSPSFTAPSKEWKDISFQIAIPKDAAFTYAYAIRVSQKPDPTTPTTVTAKLIGELVLPVLLNVKNGDSKAELTLESFKPASFINEYLPSTFNIRLANTGNVYLKPLGDIFIRSSTGEEVATIDINPNHGAILPDGKRTYQVDWSDGFFVREPVVIDGAPQSDAKGKPVTKLVINWNKVTAFRFGKYTATALVVYDNGMRDISIEQSTSFWVIPYKLIGVILGSVIGLFLLIKGILKHYISKEIKKRATSSSS